MTDLKHIAVVCTFPFPEGLAASARIIAYLKGLSNKNVHTEVFIYRPTELYGVCSGYGVDGTINGVEYHYPNTRNYSKYKIIRVVFKYYYYLITCYKILKSNKKEQIDYLFISNDFLDILFLFTAFGKVAKIKTIFITDEYPEPIRVYLAKDIPLWKKMMYNFILKKQNSLIFMTEYLNDFYNSKLKKPYHILPSITDTSRFDISINEKIDCKYLCYMGNMELSKDNVDNIIYAFNIIKDNHPDVFFFLYGAPSPKDEQYLKNIIFNLGLGNRVFIKGRVNSSEVPSILKKAYVLVSSQPKTKRAEGGFPTKLGEYMSTGIPTILTDVGEITKYVKDGVHIHIVPAENPEAYAEKLDYILSNYDECLKIADYAKKYIKENFDYNVVSSNLYDFLVGRI